MTYPSRTAKISTATLYKRRKVRTNQSTGRPGSRCTRMMANAAKSPIQYQNALTVSQPKRRIAAG